VTISIVYDQLYGDDVQMKYHAQTCLYHWINKSCLWISNVIWC